MKTFEVARTIEVPPSPQEVLVRPDGKVAYVSCDVPGKVAAIRTSDWTVETIIDAGTSTHDALTVWRWSAARTASR